MNSLLSFMLLLICIICITSWGIEKGVVEGKLKKHSKRPRPSLPPTIAHKGFANHTRCKSERDCSKDECCAFVKTNAVKVCKKISLLGETCNPNARPGLPEKCLCQQGLSCTLMRNATTVFRCLNITGSPFDRENDED